MAIERVESFVLVHHMERGRGPSIANYRTRESVLLKVTDSRGAVGWGETYASAGMTSILRYIGQLLLGRDPLRAGEIWALADAMAIGNSGGHGEVSSGNIGQTLARRGV